MKLETTFWSENIEEFQCLLYINGNTKEVIFTTDLNDAFSTYVFFKNISKFVKSSIVLKTIDNSGNKNEDFYQFALIDKEEIVHIKWFDLIINEKVTISHDTAFDTTLIKKNKFDLSFGRFPFRYDEKIKLPKYRQFNMKARAYNYIANQIKKSVF